MLQKCKEVLFIKTVGKWQAAGQMKLQTDVQFCSNSELYKRSSLSMVTMLLILILILYIYIC